jgi:hypothetical protein
MVFLFTGLIVFYALYDGLELLSITQQNYVFNFMPATLKAAVSDPATALALRLVAK